jgi:hypothetical protein
MAGQLRKKKKRVRTKNRVVGQTVNTPANSCNAEKSVKFKHRHALQNDKVGLAIAIAWKFWCMDIDEASQWVQCAIIST